MTDFALAFLCFCWKVPHLLTHSLTLPFSWLSKKSCDSRRKLDLEKMVATFFPSLLLLGTTSMFFSYYTLITHSSGSGSASSSFIIARFLFITGTMSHLHSFSCLSTFTHLLSFFCCTFFRLHTDAVITFMYPHLLQLPILLNVHWNVKSQRKLTPLQFQNLYKILSLPLPPSKSLAPHLSVNSPVLLLLWYSLRVNHYILGDFISL